MIAGNARRLIAREGNYVGRAWKASTRAVIRNRHFGDMESTLTNMLILWIVQ
ncbi:MAG TPA: hypothetical protein VNO75_09700 [Gemmatimonadaceae bacterium]|nr:hypothetical protein [Gemmatimonadaceae bacterium]